MTDDHQDAAWIRQRSLSRWDGEGGAVTPNRTGAEKPIDDLHEYPPLTNAELLHLRIRVIALENLVIAVLNQASDRQLDVAREMAEFISPLPGYTQHSLTLKAAEHMTDILDRAARFQATPAVVAPSKTTPGV